MTVSEKLKRMTDVVDVSKYLPQHRLNHSLRVAETTIQLGALHQLPRDKCYLAGLYHDIAKYLSPSKAAELNLVISDETNACWFDFPLVWHQFAGAEIINQLAPTTPDEIIDAIRWHTTGTSDMPLLSQLVFVADAIEPGRTYPDRDTIASFAHTDLNLATYAVSLGSITNLIQRRVAIHPESLACHNFYLSKIKPDDARLVPCSFLQ